MALLRASKPRWILAGVAASGLWLAPPVLLGCSGDEQAPPPAPQSRPEPRAVAASPRNIILISLDTLRADHLGLYGYERFTSPTLDALASQGVVFDDASTVAPWTLPAHASMLSGRFPKSHQVTSMSSKLPARVPTLATLLAANGFDTAAVVSSEWLRREVFNVTKDFNHYQWVRTRPWRRNPSTWVTDQAMEWLREARQASKRLFLFVHYYDLHTSYSSQPAYEALFVRPYSGHADGTGLQMSRANWAPLREACRTNPDLAACPEVEELAPGKKRDEGETAIELGPLAPFDAEDLDHLRDLYDAEIRQLDTELGRFFALLRMEGFLDDALLIVTSDHGEEFMEHGHVEHFLSLQPQEVIHVPLLLRGPGIPAGLRLSAPVSIVDIAPTILAQLEIPAPRWLEGMDLSPLWRASDEAGRSDARRPYETRFLYAEAGGGQSFGENFEDFIPLAVFAVRKGRYKLLYESMGDSYKLFDLKADPREQVDIFAQQPAIAQELVDEMERRHPDSHPAPSQENQVDLTPEERKALRSLGYIP